MDTMMELPMGLALTPCDQLIEDRLTGKKSIIGIIGEIRARKLPLHFPNMHLLVSLTSGRGDFPCRLQIVNAATDEEIFSSKGRLKMHDPTQVVDLVFTLPVLQFQTAGLHWIRFKIDEVTLMTRPLNIIEVPAPETTQPSPPKAD